MSAHEQVLYLPSRPRLQQPHSTKVALLPTAYVSRGPDAPGMPESRLSQPGVECNSSSQVRVSGAPLYDCFLASQVPQTGKSSGKQHQVCNYRGQTAARTSTNSSTAESVAALKAQRREMLARCKELCDNIDSLTFAIRSQRKIRSSAPEAVIRKQANSANVNALVKVQYMQAEESDSDSDSSSSCRGRVQNLDLSDVSESESAYSQCASGGDGSVSWSGDNDRVQYTELTSEKPEPQDDAYSDSGDHLESGEYENGDEESREYSSHSEDEDEQGYYEDDDSDY